MLVKKILKGFVIVDGDLVELKLAGDKPQLVYMGENPKKGEVSGKAVEAVNGMGVSLEVGDDIILQIWGYKEGKDLVPVCHWVKGTLGKMGFDFAETVGDWGYTQFPPYAIFID